MPFVRILLPFLLRSKTPACCQRHVYWQAGSAFIPPKKSLFAIAKEHVKAGESVLVAVNSTNMLGACAFCTVDLDGVAAVRPGRYSITIGDGASSIVPPIVTTAVMKNLHLMDEQNR